MTNSKEKPTAEIINPGLGDIEKVRDILFGKYVTGFEARFADLESRLEADVDQLKQRLSDKISTMDKMVNRSLEKIDQQIANEQQSRDAELGALQKMLGDAESALQHSINLMEDQANQDLASIKKAMQTTQQELVDHLESQKRELDNDKVGRQALALLLDEVAIKLRGASS